MTTAIDKQEAGRKGKLFSHILTGSVITFAFAWALMGIYCLFGGTIGPIKLRVMSISIEQPFILFGFKSFIQCIGIGPALGLLFGVQCWLIVAFGLLILDTAKNLFCRTRLFNKSQDEE